MIKMRTLSQRYAIPFSISVLLMHSLLRIVSGLVCSFLPRSIVTSYFSELVDILVPVALLVLCGYGFALTMKGFGKTLKAGIGVLLLFTLFLITAISSALSSPETQWREPAVIVLGILSMIGVGIREEVICRGLVGNILILKYGKTTKGLWGAIVLSSFLFGAIHLANFFAGVQISGLISQIISAISLGILFTAIYLRGGNIWVPVIIHAVIDAFGLFESTFVVTALSEVDQISGMGFRGLFFTVPIEIGLALFLLRKSKRPAVFARLDQIREELSL